MNNRYYTNPLTKRMCALHHTIINMPLQQILKAGLPTIRMETVQHHPSS